MEYHTLENGLRIIHQQVGNTEVGHFGLFINVGSRDEEKGEEGIAHFLEHVLFKGTNKRKSFHILNRLDSVGGELNAYTTKEETCIYAGFLTTYLDRTIELISDIVLNSNFPEEELIKEKEVVLDEIQSYKDSPSEQIFEDFDENLFKGHALGRDILGTNKDVKRITKKKVLEFVRKHYQPENMVVSSVGDYSMKKLVRILNKYFNIESKGKYDLKRNQFSAYKKFDISLPKDTHQCHAMLGAEAYSFKSDKRLGMVLLSNILGGPAMNSRLSLGIREKYGITYNIESGYTPFSDSGVFSVYFGTDKKNLDKTFSLVAKELNKFRNKKMSSRQLVLAKQQLKGHLALGMESKSGLMQSMGKSFLNFDQVDSIETSLAKIDNISVDDIWEISNEIFDPSKLSRLIYISK